MEMGPSSLRAFEHGEEGNFGYLVRPADTFAELSPRLDKLRRCLFCATTAAVLARKGDERCWATGDHLSDTTCPAVWLAERTFPRPTAKALGHGSLLGYPEDYHVAT
jgi:hypothetical protein